MHTFGINNYWLFVVSAILLNITPGADTIYILSRSVSQGKSAGIASVLGIGTGCLIHTVSATLGLSIVLSRSLIVYNAIKLIGALYLIYLGIGFFRDRSKIISYNSNDKNDVPFLKIYLQGILTNVSNPKVALFFISFIPQFIDTSHAFGPVPFLILGLTFFTTGTSWCFFLAIFSSLITKKLRNSGRASDIIQKISGSIIVFLGLKIAFDKK
jgi:threonine/homoserine/homoserine lactone efflux protein